MKEGSRELVSRWSIRMAQSCLGRDSEKQVWRKGHAYWDTVNSYPIKCPYSYGHSFLNTTSTDVFNKCTGSLGYASNHN